MSRQISSADRVGNSALSTVATLNLANRHGAAGSESGTSVIAALASRAVRDPLTMCDSSALCDAGRRGGHSVVFGSDQRPGDARSSSRASDGAGLALPRRV